MKTKFKVGDRVVTVRECGLKYPYIPMGTVLTVDAVAYEPNFEEWGYHVGGDVVMSSALELVRENPLAGWEPIEYRSPTANDGYYEFIRWDGFRGKWEAVDHNEWFNTPEAAAEWLTKETKDA